MRNVLLLSQADIVQVVQDNLPPGIVGLRSGVVVVHHDRGVVLYKACALSGPPGIETFVRNQRVAVVLDVRALDGLRNGQADLVVVEPLVHAKVGHYVVVCLALVLGLQGPYVRIADMDMVPSFLGRG